MVSYEILYEWVDHLFLNKESGYRILVRLKKEKQEKEVLSSVLFFVSGMLFTFGVLQHSIANLISSLDDVVYCCCLY